MKKVVVLGGTASLAKHLIPELSKSYQVVSMGRRNCDIFCDLTKDLEVINFPEDTHAVIHVAACSDVNSDEDMIQTEAVNALGTLKVCMAAHRAKVKHLIVISSIYVTLDEKSSYYNIYSISKKHSEDLAAYYCKCKELPLTILRPSQIYDDKGYFRSHQPLLYLMADYAEAGKDIVIYGSNDAKRNYIHVEDLIEIIDRTIKTVCVGLYSCSNPTDVKLSDIAQAALSSFNRGGTIKFLNGKSDIPDNVFLNDISLYKKINFYPKIDIFEGMKKLSNYRRKNV